MNCLTATHLRNRLRLATAPQGDARHGINVIIVVDLATDPPTATLDPQGYQLTHTQRLRINEAIRKALLLA